MAHALIYIPSIINVILFAPFGVLKDQQYLLVQSDFGWINTMPLTPMIAPVLTLFSTLRKINLIVKRERERIVSRESKELLEEDRLRLFQI